MAESDHDYEVSEPGGALDMRAAELTSVAVFHREEWTPGPGGDGSEPASLGSIGALICSVSMELSQAASYLGIREGDIDTTDAPGLPVDEIPLRLSLLFARAAAACVCAIAEIHPEMIEEHPNRMERRAMIIDVLDERIFEIEEEDGALPGDVRRETEADLDPSAWLRSAVSLLGISAGHVASAYGVAPLSAGETNDLRLAGRRQRTFLLMRRRIDIANSLDDVAVICALAAAWFERNADELELDETLIDFSD